MAFGGELEPPAPLPLHCSTTHHTSFPSRATPVATPPPTHSLLSLLPAPRANPLQVRRIVPADLQFVIDDITSGDPSKVGIKW